MEKANDDTISLDLAGNALQVGDGTKGSIKLLNIVSVETLTVFQELEVELDCFARFDWLGGALFAQLQTRVS